MRHKQVPRLCAKVLRRLFGRACASSGAGIKACGVILLSGRHHKGDVFVACGHLWFGLGQHLTLAWRWLSDKAGMQRRPSFVRREGLRAVEILVAEMARKHLAIVSELGAPRGVDKTRRQGLAPLLASARGGWKSELIKIEKAG